MKTILRLGLAAALLVGAMAVPAFAKDGDVIKSGSCSGSSEKKIKLSEEDGGIEVEFEVDQNVVGAKWRVRLVHEGNVFYRSIRKTKAPSGSFEVRRVTGNKAGADDFVARARNLKTDELCRITATF